MRLIDADALLDKFIEYVSCSNNSDFVSTPTWNDAVEIVESMPTIEAEPRRRQPAHWIPEEGNVDEYGNQYYNCSVCGRFDRHNPSLKVNYCWYCGAKMDYGAKEVQKCMR